MTRPRRPNDGSLPPGSRVLNAYAIVYAGLLMSAGMLADRLGRRRVFLPGLTLFTVALAMCAFALDADPLDHHERGLAPAERCVGTRSA